MTPLASPFQATAVTSLRPVFLFRDFWDGFDLTWFPSWRSSPVIELRVQTDLQLLRIAREEEIL